MKLNRKEVFKALQDSETYGTVLHAICLKTYGDDLYTMDSIEVYQNLEDDYGTLPHQDNENKIMAMVTAVSTPLFYEDLEVFKATSKTLLGGDPGVIDSSFDPPELIEVLWATYEVGLNAEALPYDRNIENYIEAMLTKEQAIIEETGEDLMTHNDRVMNELAQELEDQLKAVGFDEEITMPGKVPQEEAVA